MPVTAVAWATATRIVFAPLPWRDPLDDIVEAGDRATVDAALADLEQTIRHLAPGPSGLGEDTDLPLRRAIAGRFAAVGDRVLYVARDRATAVAEVVHHQERRARRGCDPAHPITMQVLRIDGIVAGPHDLTGLRDALPALYDPDDYAQSVAFARALRRTAAPDGVLYASVRHAGGTNLALFRRRYAAIRAAGLIQLDWDGQRIRGHARLG